MPFAILSSLLFKIIILAAFILSVEPFLIVNNWDDLLSTSLNTPSIANAPFGEVHSWGRYSALVDCKMITSLRLKYVAERFLENSDLILNKNVFFDIADFSEIIYLTRASFFLGLKESPDFLLRTGQSISWTYDEN